MEKTFLKKKNFWLVTLPVIFGAVLFLTNSSYGNRFLQILNLKQASAQSNIGQWGVYEITLTSQSSYTNPYLEVDLSATFNGPDSITKTVKGFWDGGNTYRIRFSPTVQGTWSYTTSSNRTGDSGLHNRSGTFSVGAPSSGNRGFVRRDSGNPYSFVFDDGTRYFMWGQTYYEIIRNAQAGNNWQMAITNSKAKGINKVRMLLYPWPANENPYPDSQPFVSNTDHDRLNLSHWQKFDEIIRYLESQGMVVDLVLFTDTDRAYGQPYYTDTGKAKDYRYLRYVLARYGAYHNVIWCLTNEWNYTVYGWTEWDQKMPTEQEAKNYWSYLGSIIRNEDPWIQQGNSFRALSIHQRTRVDFQFFNQTPNWPIQAIIQYGLGASYSRPGDDYGNAGILYNSGRQMPVVNDEYGYIGETRNHPEGSRTQNQTNHRQTIWGIAVGGGYGSAGDFRNNNSNISAFSSDWRDASEYDDIKRMVDFWTTKGIEYWKMSSQNSRLSGTRVYALGNPNSGSEEFVVYAAVGGTFTINLPTTASSYQVVRYNPRDGTQASLSAVGGGSRQFSMPDSNDWVLWLKRPQSSNQPPAAVASANPTSGLAPLTVNFNSDQSSDPDGTIASRSWDFGDGGTSTQANPRHVYQTGGTFTVTLTVTDDRGATGNTSVTITVSTGPGDGDLNQDTKINGMDFALLVKDWTKQASSTAFSGSYYNNTNFSGTPVLTRDDPLINFDWGYGSPDSAVNADYFSVRWTKTQALDAGNYTFTTTTDDGVRLWIDNNLIIDQWVNQAPTTNTATLDLTSGNHVVRMDYYEAYGGAVARLSWMKN